jgi:hypothetical protein
LLCQSGLALTICNLSLYVKRATAGFLPSAIDRTSGIDLTLVNEPPSSAYAYGLEKAKGVAVGLGQRENVWSCLSVRLEKDPAFRTKGVDS